MNRGDIEFIRHTLLPWSGVRAVYITHSGSRKKWPDIWIEMRDIPIITITEEWKRQGVHERRKRLTHEFLHLRGMKHDEKKGYSTIPSRDSYSRKVYRELIKV